IVALIAPAFVEDLFELFFRIEVHPQRVVQTAAARLRRSSISVNNEHLGSWLTSRAPTSAETAATTSRPVDDLASIGADFERRHATGKSRRPAIAQAITN